MSSPAVSYYFQRFGFCPQQIQEPPHPNLGMVVVVPCYNEPSLLQALEALWRCARPESAVEVIVVINSSERAPPDIKEQNLRSLKEASFWSREDCDRYFRVHLLHFPDMPPKHAGVGLARKIGMDEALRRFDPLNRLDGVIACFDADSTCDPTYLVELERFFAAHPKRPGCSIYFEHPLEPAPPSAALRVLRAESEIASPDLDPQIYEAITAYELHLRYYVEALRFAGFPHAYHTIGSSMAVRASAYLAQGGMNRRKAGEDFYFLHKIIPLGHFGEVNTTRIIPSPRPSDRVPFGTGRAVREYLATHKFETYPLQAFHDLKFFFSQVETLATSLNIVARLAPPLQEFLSQRNATASLAQIRENTSTSAAFRKRFFHWFDGFMALKYIHHAQDTAYGSADLVSAAHMLLGLSTTDAREILLHLRQIQRSGSHQAHPKNSKNT